MPYILKSYGRKALYKPSTSFLLNFIKNPTMLIDFDANGIADDWAIQEFNSGWQPAEQIEYTPSIDGGQRLDITGGSGTGYLRFLGIPVDGASAVGLHGGDTIKIGATIKSVGLATNLTVEYFDSGWGFLKTDEVGTVQNGDFATISSIITLHEDADKVAFVFRIDIDTLGKTGQVWMKDALFAK